MSEFNVLLIVKFFIFNNLIYLNFILAHLQQISQHDEECSAEDGMGLLKWWVPQFKDYNVEESVNLFQFFTYSNGKSTRDFNMWIKSAHWNLHESW